MKITITPTCEHRTPEGSLGYTGSGEPMVGRHVVISAEHVILDGDCVIVRDRRLKRNREPGHPWLTTTTPRLGHRDFAVWTGFRVTVEP